MSIVRGENKIAVLLTSLPRAAAENVLTLLGPERGSRLRGLMEQVRREITPELMDEVLQEFEEALSQATHGSASPRPRLALSTVSESDTYESSHTNASTSAPREADEIPREPARIGSPTVHAFPQVDEVIAELQLIESDRLASALQGEHPRGVATVLSYLDATKAREALMLLPPDVRRDIFPRLGRSTGGNTGVALQIVRAVIAKSRAAAAAESGAPSGDNKAQMMAEMLKSMERADRAELMRALTERDEALAAAVRERLYVFEDLLEIEGQVMQKLLAEIDSKTLAVALHEASETIIDKVMANLSKRARESLTEEISFLGDISASYVQEAQKAVVDVIQRMDQAEEAG